MDKKSFTNVLTELKKPHAALRDQERFDTAYVKLHFDTFEKVLLDNSFSKQQEQTILTLFGSDFHKYRTYLEQTSGVLEAEYKQKTLEKGKVDLRYIKKTILFHKFPKLVRDEIKAAAIIQTDKLLFIGSGAFPISSIIYNKYSQCSVDCLELLADRVDESRQLIHKLKLEKAIRIRHGHGQNFSNDNYTVIVVALQIESKKEVLEHIAAEMPSGTRVLCRVQSGLGKIFNADQENNEMYDKFVLQERVSKDDNIITTLILKTK